MLKSLGQRAWHLRWLIAANLYLLSPILLYELRLDQGGPDKTLLFVLPASLLWLLSVQLIFRRPWLTHLLLFPFYVTVLVDLFTIVHYDTRLASSMVLVIVDNLDHAREYLQANARPILAAGALMLFGHCLLLWNIRDLRMSASRRSLALALAGLAALYGVVKLQVGELTHLATHDRSSPFGILAQSYTAQLVLDETQRQAQLAADFRFGARRSAAPAGPEAYVLVIGESSRHDHWALYGYGRDTTPRLSARQDLVTFSEVVSQASFTKAAVPLLLTRGVVGELERTARERSIVSAFAEVGFDTYWLSTQQRDPFTGTINRYSGEAAQQLYFERRHDEILAERAAEVLASPAAQKVFLVIHMNGSHFTYTSRYPASFDAFGADRGDRRQRMINAYDNTVRYTDFVLSQLIDALEKRAGSSALLYVSDHGENLEDDARALTGHYHSNEYDLPVPMVLWHSAQYAARSPERIAAARANHAVPLTTRSVFHSLLQMANITVDDPETARLSVYSDQLEQPPRMVLKGSTPVDFDSTFASRPCAHCNEDLHGGRAHKSERAPRYPDPSLHGHEAINTAIHIPMPE